MPFSSEMLCVTGFLTRMYGMQFMLWVTYVFVWAKLFEILRTVLFGPLGNMRRRDE